jgi:hypothetical protein
MPPAAPAQRRGARVWVHQLNHFSPFFGHLAPVFIEKFAIICIAFVALASLSACSGLRIVDSQVSTFSKLETAPVAGSTWRFERLPSQQNLEPSASLRRSKIEAMAAQALAQHGFQAQPESATPANKPVAYTVQVSVRLQRLEHGPFDDPVPFGAWGWAGRGVAGRDYVVTGAGRVIPVGPLLHVPMPWYVREISLILRDGKDNRVVYETQARNEGRWSDDEALLPAMFTAALQGFPKPPEGPRMVNIEIPQ